MILIHSLTLQITEDKVRYPDKADRYEVPMNFNLPDGGYHDASALYEVKYTQATDEEFSIQVIRKSTNTTMYVYLFYI